LRLPPLIAGLATIPLTYVLGSLTIGRKAGMFGALLIAVNPFMIFYSAEARPYGTLVCLTLLSTISLIVAVRGRGPGWWIAFALFCAASMYTHYTAVFVLSAQFIWASACFKGLRVRLLHASAGVAVLFLPWLPEYLADGDSPGANIIEMLQPFGLEAARSGVVHWPLIHPLLPGSQLPGGSLGRTAGLC
jgi:uncharacterized membrane protein